MDVSVDLIIGIQMQRIRVQIQIQLGHRDDELVQGLGVLEYRGACRLIAVGVWLLLSAPVPALTRQLNLWAASLVAQIVHEVEVILRACSFD